MTFAAATLCALLVSGQAPPPRPPTPAGPTSAARPAAVEPPAVLNAEKAWAGADVLLPLVAARDRATQTAALRAIGRLEDPRLVPRLVTLEGVPLGPLADAVAQSLKGFNPATDPHIITQAHDWMRRIGSQPIAAARDLDRVAPVILPLGRVAYVTAEQVRATEEILRTFADRTASPPELQSFYGLAIRSFESLARLNVKVTPLATDSVNRLAGVVAKKSANDRNARIRLTALSALINARALDATAELAALKDDDWQVRRLAMTVLAGDGAGLDEAARLRLIREGLADRAPQVRYEAVRAYARRGAQAGACGPLAGAVDDRDMNVALAAIDALGDACKGDDAATARLASEAGIPAPGTSWHRGAHAFVALAKRSPDRAATSMAAFATHPVPWVRMYAVRAAAAVGDLARLEALATDPDDNVREAALGLLRRSKAPNAEAAIVAGLDRTGYQVVRMAATLLKESPRDPRLARPLLASLMRVTKDHSETSRDARLPLLEAIAVHGTADDAAELAPLLTDFDPKVAEQAAQVIARLTGTIALPNPAPVTRGWPQAFADLRQCLVVSLASGKTFGMRMHPEAAPVTVDRFLALATIDHYFDGLTIHRVVPNFVIQGGSPGANEYVGHKEFMRDEIALPNSRGTVGLSTRGRNTADAQFFVNLIDNLRLDYDYTVFASVNEADLAVVDAIQEGDVMRGISRARCAAK
jgi:cyclophilin family peptidyl-prolyl cis-trans isomerase